MFCMFCSRSTYCNVMLLCRALQAVLGWKLSVLMVIHITTTHRLEVRSLSLISFVSGSEFAERLDCNHMVDASCLTESSWEKPADFPSNEDSGSSREDESQEEPSAPEPEPLSEGESSNGAPAPQEVPEEPKEQPKVPKISFRVREEKLVEIVGKHIPQLILNPLF